MHGARRQVVVIGVHADRRCIVSAISIAHTEATQREVGLRTSPSSLSLVIVFCGPSLKLTPLEVQSHFCHHLSKSSMNGAKASAGGPLRERETMWNPDVKLARSFLAVAQEKSVTAAARLLNSTQPTVSGHLKELESQLDFTLFERSTRRVELTIEGTKILPAFARLIECADEIECSMKQIRSTKRDTFRLAATMYTIDIPERTELLDGFDNEFPRIGYSVENYLQSEQIPKLIAGLLDVSLLLGCQVTADQYEKIQCNVDKAAVANELQYPDTLERMVIGTRDIQLLVPEESHLAEFDIIPATALQGWTISMLGPGHGAMLTDPIIAFLEKYGAQVYVPEIGRAHV